MGFLDGFAENFKTLPSSAKKKLEAVTDYVIGQIPENKRKPALICAGVTVFLLILVTVTTIAREEKPAIREFPSGPILAISGDELFIPVEPDFLPDYLPEREPNPNWDLDDIRLYWKNPGQGNLDIWRDEISAAIDKIMETVP